ncbi:MAG: ribonuclease R [Gemmatimonadetes bacterium]|nr:ribonuclease R [Gemmatimonadota bacterium]MDA1104340.1 ribonuclease R [Gemmatimonadota bacterium]
MKRTRKGRAGPPDSTVGDSGQSLEARVLAALAGSDRGPLKTKELARALTIPAGDYRSFRRLLAGLEKSGKIYRTKGHRYAVAAKLDLVTGSLSITRNGDGFIRPDDGGEDVFVPGQRLATAMVGDRVVARIERRPRGRSREGTVIRILDRARETLVGTFHRGPKFSYVTPLDVRLTRDVLVASDDDQGAQDGEVVVVRIVTYGDGRVSSVGSIERVLGSLSDPGVDVVAVAYGFGISLEFEPDVDSAAAAAAKSGSLDGGPDRVDRTDLLCFTIDPADAKDHDDALSLTEAPDGTVEVGVHIADVSHFVRRDTPVDIEAAARGTSVYLVDRTIPMLPAVLSNDVCSLRAGEARFAVSLFMTLDGEGRVTSRRYERTRIRCSRGLSYEEAQEVLDGVGSISPDVDGALRGLVERARLVRALRYARGALDFDLPEAKVVLDDEGLPIDIKRRERKESHRLVEDFMILANEVVANDLEARGLATLYRVHEPPTPERVEALAETLLDFGLKVSRRKALKPSDMQGLLTAVKGREEESLVSSLVLRSLKKARYHTENLGHFGLASEGYLHFTSPIRRYPDLIVHRVLTAAFVHGSAPPYRDAEDLVSTAEQCSVREQAAEEAERASVALKKVEFMERHLGDTFSGRVSGVAAFGFFVTLEEFFVDGLVHVSGLQDDFYHFRAKDHALVGERGGRRFRLGDRVEVQVARVDKEARQIDFQVVRKL